MVFTLGARRARRHGALALTAGLAAMALVGCATAAPSASGTDSEDKPIIIGAAVGLSGLLSTYDGEPMNALKIYVDDLNAKGGIDGRRVEIVTSDTKSDAANGPTAAKAVIAKGADIVLVSCDFDFGSPAALTAVAEGKLTFSLCAGSPLFGPEGIGDLAFTAGVAAASHGAAEAQWGYNEKGWRSAYVMTDKTVGFYQLVSSAFKTSWAELGGTISGETTMLNADASIADQVARIKALSPQPDVLVFSSFLPGGASFVRQIRAAGIDIPIVSNNSMEGGEWLESVPDLTDFYFTSVALLKDDARPEVDELTATYTEQFGAPQTSWTYHGYAIGQLLTAAIEGTDGSTDGATLASWFEKAGPIDTIIGPFEFSKDFHIAKNSTLQVSEITGGENVNVGEITPTNVPLTNE